MMSCLFIFAGLVAVLCFYVAAVCTLCHFLGFSSDPGLAVGDACNTRGKF